MSMFFNLEYDNAPRFVPAIWILNDVPRKLTQERHRDAGFWGNVEQDAGEKDVFG